MPSYPTVKECDHILSYTDRYGEALVKVRDGTVGLEKVSTEFNYCPECGLRLKDRITGKRENEYGGNQGLGESIRIKTGTGESGDGGSGDTGFEWAESSDQWLRDIFQKAEGSKSWSEPEDGRAGGDSGAGSSGVQGGPIMSISVQDATDRYGLPKEEAGMVIWNVPADLQLPAIPRRIYCNRDMVVPLAAALTNVRNRKMGHEIVTWDGCFNIRGKKGKNGIIEGSLYSLHSWGLAIDINAAWNGFGSKPTMSKELVSCFADAGFYWGGSWSTPDGMHFELVQLPAKDKK
jgi:hypothetical protein